MPQGTSQAFRERAIALLKVLRIADAVYYCCESCDHLWVVQKPGRTKDHRGHAGAEAGATLKARRPD